MEGLTADDLSADLDVVTMGVLAHKLMGGKFNKLSRPGGKFHHEDVSAALCAQAGRGLANVYLVGCDFKGGIVDMGGATAIVIPDLGDRGFALYHGSNVFFNSIIFVPHILIMKSYNSTRRWERMTVGATSSFYIALPVPELVIELVGS